MGHIKTLAIIENQQTVDNILDKSNQIDIQKNIENKFENIINNIEQNELLSGDVKNVLKNIQYNYINQENIEDNLKVNAEGCLYSLSFLSGFINEDALSESIETNIELVCEKLNFNLDDFLIDDEVLNLMQEEGLNIDNYLFLGNEMKNLIAGNTLVRSSMRTNTQEAVNNINLKLDNFNNLKYTDKNELMKNSLMSLSFNDINKTIKLLNKKEKDNIYSDANLNNQTHMDNVILMLQSRYGLNRKQLKEMSAELEANGLMVSTVRQFNDEINEDNQKEESRLNRNKEIRRKLYKKLNPMKEKAKKEMEESLEKNVVKAGKKAFTPMIKTLIP